MEVATGSVQSAVDSLVGRLTSALLDEAQLLSGVSGDVAFIKREMESMSGFLLDASGQQRSTNQFRAWTRQVQELAFDSQSCVDHYVQTFGSTLWRAPWTVLARRRIAKQIRELKARSLEVAERRQRYGLTPVLDMPLAARQEAEGTSKAKEVDDAPRRRAFAEALALVDADARAEEVVEWMLTRKQMPERDRFLHATMDSAPMKFYLLNFLASRQFNFVELYGWLKGLCDGHDLATEEGKTTRLARQFNEMANKYEVKVKKEIRQWDEWLQKKVSAALGHDRPEPQVPTAALDSSMEDPWEVTRWMKKIFGVRHPQGQGLQVLFVISLPTIEGFMADSGGENSMDVFTGKDLARRVYLHPCAVESFNCRVWVDARTCSQRGQRLQSILQQLSSSAGAGGHDPITAGNSRSGDYEAELEQKIQQHLHDKRFLIVLNDPEDDSAWTDIREALPIQGDFKDGSAVMVTPSIEHQMDRAFGWLTARLLFLNFPGDLPYKVHVYFLDSEAVCKKADELCNKKMADTVSRVLTKCGSDSFSIKMVLRDLYINPHRSKEEWDRLLPDLEEFSTASNAKHIIRFCYDELPSMYKTCLLYLSIFPPKSMIRRTSLVRRWAAEGLVTKRDRLSATDEAKHCFDALIDRGLVLPSNTSPTGTVKSCTVHPHVLSFISRITREDDNTRNTDLPLDLAHRLSIRNDIHLQQITKKRQSTCYSDCWKTFKPSTTTTNLHDRKLDIIMLLNMLPAPQLGLIKVLDLEGCPGLNKKCLKIICNKIFQLKYLSLRNTDIDQLPKQIDKLQYLETFDIRQTMIREFPTKSITLSKLVHLLAGGHGDPQGKDDATGSGEKLFSALRIPHEIGSMTNMQILSNVDVLEGDDEDVLNSVGRLQQLRKLGVVIHGKQAPLTSGKQATPITTNLLRVVSMLKDVLCSLSIYVDKDVADGADMNTTEPTFSAPRSLENLHISGKINGLPTWIKELEQLSKITLSWTSLGNTDIRILGNLGNLRFIRLGHKSYTQSNLTFRTGFQKVEVLVIESSDICNIHFEPKAAPKLEKIIWSSTCKIETLGIEKLPCLKEIEINGNCEVSRIEKSVGENPNHPKLKYRTPKHEDI
ncbi:unnamed protein product [Urochloa humidicola]